jgi:hypothetical protein
VLGVIFVWHQQAGENIKLREKEFLYQQIWSNDFKIINIVIFH